MILNSQPIELASLPQDLLEGLSGLEKYDSITYDEDQIDPTFLIGPEELGDKLAVGDLKKEEQQVYDVIIRVKDFINNTLAENDLQAANGAMYYTMMKTTGEHNERDNNPVYDTNLEQWHLDSPFAFLAVGNVLPLDIIVGEVEIDTDEILSEVPARYSFDSDAYVDQDMLVKEAVEKSEGHLVRTSKFGTLYFMDGHAIHRRSHEINAGVRHFFRVVLEKKAA